MKKKNPSHHAFIFIETNSNCVGETDRLLRRIRHLTRGESRRERWASRNDLTRSNWEIRCPHPNNEVKESKGDNPSSEGRRYKQHLWRIRPQDTNHQSLNNWLSPRKDPNEIVVFGILNRWPGDLVQHAFVSVHRIDREGHCHWSHRSFQHNLLVHTPHHWTDYPCVQPEWRIDHVEERLPTTTNNFESKILLRLSVHSPTL